MTFESGQRKINVPEVSGREFQDVGAALVNAPVH